MRRHNRSTLTSDGSVNNSPIFELDRDRLVVELHQKSAIRPLALYPDKDAQPT